MVSQATEMLVDITDNYNQLLNEIESKLGDRYMILDAVEHDKLLIDDGLLMRSRRYFWIIDALDTFTVTIEESIKKYSGFINELKSASSKLNQEKHGSTEDPAFTKFKELRGRIQELRDRAITRRDGVRILLFYNIGLNLTDLS
jgi:hypothetical protein